MTTEAAEIAFSIVILWGAAVVSYLSILAQQEALPAEAGEQEEAEDPPQQGSNFTPSRHGCRGGLHFNTGWYE
jgi:threonine/homoserine/homoserine lactone efflux protein